MIEAAASHLRFVQKYKEAYSPRQIYYLLNHDELLGTNSRNFRQSRAELLDNLLTRGVKVKSFSPSYLAEYVTALSLDTLVSPFGYRIDMAPQSVEHGSGQRGVDLILRNTFGKIMLGIDIKLGCNRSSLNQNGGEWLDNLKAPFINLTLGNWKIKAREPEVVTAKDWLLRCVLPNVPGSGKIPYLDDLRRFLVPRIKNSVVSQWEGSRNSAAIARFHVPESRQDRLVYQQKLEGVRELFGRIEETKGWE